MTTRSRSPNLLSFRCSNGPSSGAGDIGPSKFHSRAGRRRSITPKGYPEGDFQGKKEMPLA
ncbi:MAG: hypothetical protein MZV64_11100 [Ignavibacteriales bacterium]|nr:hypothetical protein [Ignavibacteriales bacterium]